MPNNLVTVVINGVKSLPRDLFDKQQSLKKLSLNNIEDMFLFDPESQIDTLDLSGSEEIRKCMSNFSNDFNDSNVFMETFLIRLLLTLSANRVFMDAQCVQEVIIKCHYKN
jgi:hypothetical protein